MVKAYNNKSLSLVLLYNFFKLKIFENKDSTIVNL